MHLHLHIHNTMGSNVIYKDSAMWVVTFQHLYLQFLIIFLYLYFQFKSNILSIHTTITKNICWENCAINQQCNWFSYDQGSNQCLHFEFCPEIDENPRFISGEKECKYQIYSMWNSIAFINFYDSVIFSASRCYTILLGVFLIRYVE